MPAPGDPTLAPMRRLPRLRRWPPHGGSPTVHKELSFSRGLRLRRLHKIPSLLFSSLIFFFIFAIHQTPKAPPHTHGMHSNREKKIYI